MVSTYQRTGSEFNENLWCDELGCRFRTYGQLVISLSKVILKSFVQVHKYWNVPNITDDFSQIPPNVKYTGFNLLSAEWNNYNLNLKVILII